MMSLVRVFIPSWRFFDRVGARPRVYVGAGSSWRPLFTPPPRRWWRLLFNPAGNLHHANQNLVERLLSEVSRTDDVASLNSYRVLAHLARLDGAKHFKLVAGGEDILISPEL